MNEAERKQIEARVRAIAQRRVEHRNWLNAESAAFALLVAAKCGEVVNLIGPSRGGKTSLTRHLCGVIAPPNEATDVASPDRLMPAAYLLASNASTNGRFSSKSFTMQGLDALEHPIYSRAARGEFYARRARGLDRTPEGQLRSAFIEALYHRQVRYLFIDELQHVRYAPGGDKAAAAILDSMKCLAEESGVILVLVGAYPILNVLSLSPHMEGRTHQVHLPRYRETEDDIRAFNGLLEGYNDVVPLASSVASLRDWTEVLFRGSLGCVGLLEMWLRDAVASLGADGRLNLAHLERHRRSKHVLERLAREIADGEQLLASVGGI